VRETRPHKSAIGITRKTVNDITFKYPEFDLSPDDVSNDFHNLSLSSGNAHFKREWQAWEIACNHPL
jgi:hypothetical protein